MRVLKYILVAFLAFLVFSLFSAESALAQTPELLKRRLVASNWLSGCQDTGSTSMGTVFSFTPSGSGLVVNYGYPATGCSGFPQWITRTAVRFRTATSEEVKGAVELALEPTAPQMGAPVGFAYRLVANDDNTVTFTMLRFAVYENGRLEVKQVDPNAKGASIFFFPSQRGPSLKSFLEARIPTFERTRIDAAIHAIRAQGQYPALKLEHEPQLALRNSIPLGEGPIQFFRQFNRFLFNNENELFLYGAVKPGGAQAHPQNKTVAIDPSYESYWRLPSGEAQELMELDLAGETAVYLYELNLQRQGGDGRSVHGQKSLYSTSLDFLGPSERSNRDLVFNKAVEHALVRAEVDAYAAAGLVQMGYDSSKIRERFDKKNRLIETVLFAGNVEPETEIAFIPNEELAMIVDLYIRDLAAKRFMKQY